MKNNADSKKLDHDLTNYSATAKSALAKKAKSRKIKLTCLGFGAATSVGLVAAPVIEAAIQYSGIQNVAVGLGGSYGDVYLDLDGVGGSTYGGVPGADFRALATGYSGVVAGRNGALLAVDPASAILVKRFSSGDLIGTVGSNLGSPVDNYGFVAAGSNGNFPASAPGFVGVQLGSGNFGWVRIHWNGPNQGMTVIDWAYEDSGAHLKAGEGLQQEIPEPASAAIFMGLGLLSMGAAGVRELRRRKREAAEGSSDTAV